MKRLATTLAVLIGTAASPLVGSTPTEAAAPELRPYTTPNGMVHCTLEFESGSDLDHYAAWVLDEVGVSDSDAPGRYPNGWKLNNLDSIWLYTSQEECRDAQALTGTGPLLGAEMAQTVSLPTPVDSGTLKPLDGNAPRTNTFVPRGQRGYQETPTSLLRSGFPIDEWQYQPSSGGVKVGIIDTGIDGRHPDLNVEGGYNCSQDQRGPEGYDIDLHGHGTWVGGRVGAKHNDSYVVGGAPGVDLYSEAVFSTSSASGAMVLCGVNKALEHGVDIISASLGGGSIATRCGGPSVYINGWCKAAHKTVVVVAAGNDAEDAIFHAPANIDHPSLVTVGAIVDFDGLPGGVGLGDDGCGFTHADDAVAIFSNTGPLLEVMAPGGCELSTVPNNGIGVSSGTSMSTPEVAAVFANAAAKFPDCRGRNLVGMVLTYAERYARDHPDEGYDGWPGADPPPLIRYVDEEPLRYQDPDHPKPCQFESESR